MIAHADQIKGKAGQSLRDHVGDVVRNRRLNRLVTNLDLDVAPTADLVLRAADPLRRASRDWKAGIAANLNQILEVVR